MNDIKKLFLGLWIACACVLIVGPTSAQACPMCKTAMEDAGGENDRHPQAYMASILTMLGMPSILFTVLGVSLYRISSKEQLIADRLNEQARQEPPID